MIHILQTLVNQIGLVAFLAIIVSQSKYVRRNLAKRKRNFKDQILLVLFFSTFGIISTYMGVPVNGAIANSRVVGVFVAGLIGGPVVGLLSGIVAGLHRWAIDIGGFTAFACMLSTILEGLLGGLLKKSLQKAETKWLFAIVAGAAAEMMQMIIILIIVRPVEDAISLVSIIALPMIVANSLGIGIFIAIIESVKKEYERVAANQAELVLDIASKTLQYFRKGFNKETAHATAKIVLENTDLDAVSFTDKDGLLAFIGGGSDWKKYDDSFMSETCKKVIKQKKIIIVESMKEIDSFAEGDKLNSAVFVPIMQDAEVIGILKLYREEQNAIKPVDIMLGKGLCELFATQIELSKIEEQIKLVDQAELKALQAQINPHFLFNAINTIVSLVRTDPEKARELLQYLSLFFRNNVQVDKEEVSIHKEIEHIRSYLEIEKARFGNKLKVDFSVPPSIDCKIPPLLLQPIVENAVKHGVMVRRNGGKIKVSAKSDRRGVTITVKDNGVGIEKDRLSNLLNDDDSENSALINISKRLNIKYGDAAKLDINSKFGSGTAVILRIP
ncbi:MAG TPA: histidine kinase [Spirochaeta sp.]|nr:histidine kinase [Spirochaeta sp.]